MKRIPVTGFERLTEAVTTEYAQLIELVRQALATKVRGTPGGSDYYVEIRGIWPDRVVASMRGRLFAYGYSLAADNSVTVGEGEEVVASYQPVAAPAAAAMLEALNDTTAFREAADGSIEVTLIRAGRSGNKAYYPDTTLREAAPLFEGVRVFVKSDTEHLAGNGKDVRNLIGGIYGVRFVEGKGTDTGALVGTFKPLDPTDTAVTKMTEAVKRGMQGLLGLSIDAMARTKKRQDGTTVLREATQFVKVHSVDLIVEPGAGGGLDRLTEAAADNTPNPITTHSQELNIAMGRSVDVHTWQIRAYMALSDDTGSELVFDGLIEAFRDAVRADPTFGGTCEPDPGEQGGQAAPQLVEVAQVGPVKFCGVLCHSAVLQLRTWSYL